VQSLPSFYKKRTQVVELPEKKIGNETNLKRTYQIINNFILEVQNDYF
jgi:hypothetical protein